MDKIESVQNKIKILTGKLDKAISEIYNLQKDIEDAVGIEIEDDWQIIIGYAHDEILTILKDAKTILDHIERRKVNES